MDWKRLCKNFNVLEKKLRGKDFQWIGKIHATLIWQGTPIH